MVQETLNNGEWVRKAIRVAVVADKETQGARERLAGSISEEPTFKVVLLSRLKTSRIGSELESENPDVILITASLVTLEEIKELAGFIKKVKKPRHLPQAQIILVTRQLRESEEKMICDSGADVWIDEQVTWEALGPALQNLVAHRGVVLSPLIQPGQVKIYRN